MRGYSIPKVSIYKGIKGYNSDERPCVAYILIAKSNGEQNHSNNNLAACNDYNILNTTDYF